MNLDRSCVAARRQGACINEKAIPGIDLDQVRGANRAVRKGQVAAAMNAYGGTITVCLQGAGIKGQVSSCPDIDSPFGIEVGIQVQIAPGSKSNFLRGGTRGIPLNRSIDRYIATQRLPFQRDISGRGQRNSLVGFDGGVEKDVSAGGDVDFTVFTGHSEAQTDPVDLVLGVKSE